MGSILCLYIGTVRLVKFSFTDLKIMIRQASENFTFINKK